MESKYDETSIKSISASDWYRMRVIEKGEIDLLYVILGFLQEYMGGYGWDEEIVNGFFVNEYEQAQVFNGLCQAYLASQGMENDVTFRMDDSGHSAVGSRQICAILKRKFQVKKINPNRRSYFQLPKSDDLFKWPDELYGKNVQLFNLLRYYYLLGILAMNRHGKKHEVYIANAGHKAELAIKILREFSAFGDRSFRVTFHFNVPHVTQISLGAKNILWAEVASLIKKYKTA